ncbi:AAA family ATPase [Bartonella sp. LJL80]
MEKAAITFKVPTFTADSVETIDQLIDVELGQSVIMVGANGSGKTRLAVSIENQLGSLAHRISAHRAINLNPNVPKLGEKEARNKLFVGIDNEHISTSFMNYRASQRWNHKEATILLDDFDKLLQVLFAEQNNVALKTHKSARKNENPNTLNTQLTKFEILEGIWSRLLPNRQLDITGDDINVVVPNTELKYSASEMSDGERSLFYMIGQVLAANEGQLIIIDEPELHIHRSIMSKLWDELEAIRPDCAFLFITHDLEFAALRSAKKLVIRDYRSQPSRAWNIEEVPDNTGFSEELTTLILGSRQPILFVEGDQQSLDIALYRSCYPEWTVITRSSCGEVIHAVSTMRANPSLTRITCAGLVDNDHRNDADMKYLEDKGVYTLPVNEIENIILLPEVSRAILKYENFDGQELEDKLAQLSNLLFERIKETKNIKLSVNRYINRYLHANLKNIHISEKSNDDNIEDYVIKQTYDLKLNDVISQFKNDLDTAIKNRNLTDVLKLYDNKGLIKDAASVLRSCSKDAFLSWLMRTLKSDQNTALVKVIKAILPTIKAV